MTSGQELTLFLCGDVMIGRGIDQALPHPNPPQLYERIIHDARQYIQIAGQYSQPVPIPLSFEQVWGDALTELNRFAPDFRIVNLETSITDSETSMPDKGIHYRMNPDNIACLTAAQVDCCTLANNHVLDWGRAGLLETIATLEDVGIKYTGAGRNLAEATTPAILETSQSQRVVVASAGTASSGIPPSWTAENLFPGVNRLQGNPEIDANGLLTQIRKVKQAQDYVIVSIHWGANWDYDIPEYQIHLAHLLIDSGEVDLIHGHSSHHIKAFEIYRGKLILYGCGDFITDYEGIRGHEEFRGDLGAMYFPKVNRNTGRLSSLSLIPTTMSGFQVRYANEADIQWLVDRINRELSQFELEIQQTDKHLIELVQATESAIKP